jgi:hypothetical protein
MINRPMNAPMRAHQDVEAQPRVRRTPRGLVDDERRRMTRFQMVGLPAMAMLVVLAATGCGDSGGGTTPATATPTGTTTSTASTAASGCLEASELKDSLTALTQVDPVNDGVDALKSAAAEVRTDLDAAASTASSEIRPAVDQVQTAFGGLETTLQGVSSSGGLGAAATQIGTSLAELGTALTSLSTELGQICSGTP